MTSWNPRWRRAGNFKATIGDRQTLCCQPRSQGLFPGLERGSGNEVAGFAWHWYLIAGLSTELWNKTVFPTIKRQFALTGEVSFNNNRDLKALANEDTSLRTHCCRHKCFPVCPRAQHLLRTQILYPGHIKCFWFCSETFCGSKCFPVCARKESSWATMCPQQCVLGCQGLYAKHDGNGNELCTYVIILGTFLCRPL